MTQELVDKCSSELKQCPFCGGRAIVQLFLGRYAIVCTECPASMIPSPEGRYDEYRDTALMIVLWNSRKKRKH